MKNIQHIYDDYDLYQVLFSRDKWYKCFEGVSAAIAIEHFVSKHPRPYADGVHIVETHAGASEHEKYIRDSCAVPILSYIPTDSNPRAENVQRVNVQTDSLPFNDITLSLFTSVNSGLSGKNGYSDVQALKACATNVYNSLNSPGAWFCNVFWHVELGKRILGMHVSEYPVTSRSNLRKRYDIPMFDECTLKMQENAGYLRQLSLFKWSFGRVELCHKDKVVERWQVERPFYIKYWAEETICAILHSVGFSDFVGFSNRLPNDDTGLARHNVIDPVSFDADDLPVLTDFLAIKG